MFAMPARRCSGVVSGMRLDTSDWADSLRTPVGLSALVAVDRASGRVRGVLVDAGELERDRVGDAVVAHRVREPHRVLRRHRVEVRGVDVALLFELALVPARTLDPLARLGLLGAEAHEPRRIRGALDVRIAQVHDVEKLDASPGEVHVGVEEAGRDRAAGELDPFGAFTSEALDLGTRSHREDSTVADGHRLRDRVVGVDGEDRSADEDPVRGLFFGRRRAAHGRDDCEGRVASQLAVYHHSVPGLPLNGPTSSEVTQPP